jgi:Rrf2 family protein
MLELAINSDRGTIQLNEIARKEKISPKYLSIVIIPLRTAGLVKSKRGPFGGYSLAKPSNKITLKEIIDVLEGGMCIVDCIKDPKKCLRSDLCATRDLWTIVNNEISHKLDSITLWDLACIRRKKDDRAMMYQI